MLPSATGPGRNSRSMSMRTRKGLGTVVLWSALCVAVALLVPGPAVAEAVEADARSAHRAVWKVYGAGKTGTAFAIGDHHFVTCAHVIKDFSDHGAKEVFINQHASEDNRTLRVNYGHVALTLVQDIALFTTKETVGHSFALAPMASSRTRLGFAPWATPRVSRWRRCARPIPSRSRMNSGSWSPQTRSREAASAERRCSGMTVRWLGCTAKAATTCSLR